MFNNFSIPADFPPATLIVPLLVAVPLSAKIPTDFESLSVLVIKILPLFSISDSLHKFQPNFYLVILSLHLMS